MLDFRIVSVTIFECGNLIYYAVQTNDGGLIVYDAYVKLPEMVRNWMKERNFAQYTLTGTIIFDKAPQLSCLVEDHG